jgi:hypothetical protein
MGGSMRKYFAVIAAALLLSLTAAFADPVGKYFVEGTDPGKPSSTYTGTVTVEKTGETYSVVWVIGGTKYVGTGIGNKDFIAVSYRSGNNTGLALYAPTSEGWLGVWTYAGGTQMGTDRWVRR